MVFAQHAQAQTRTRALPATIKSATPPAEFDHPYTGQLTITRTKDQAETRWLCTPADFPQALALGCAKVMMGGGCRIIISPDSVLAEAGMTLEFVKRHEMAHCNGWPQDHRRAKQP